MKPDNVLQYSQNQPIKHRAGPRYENMEAYLNLLRKYYSTEDEDCSDLQGLDAILPNAIRQMLSSDQCPYSMLVELYAMDSEGEASRLAVSYGALLSKYPRELFEASSLEAGDPILRALELDNQSPLRLNTAYTNALCKWREDDSSDECVLSTVVDKLALRLGNPKIVLGDVFGLVGAANILFSAEECMDWLLSSDFGEKLLLSIAGCPVLRINQKQDSFNQYAQVADVLIASLHSLLLRSLKRNRLRTTSILLAFANKNKDRLKMQYDHQTVCSDPAAIVVLGTLLRLSEPFMAYGVRDRKEPLIDPLYYKRYKGRIDITGLNTITDSTDDNIVKQDAGEPNFVSDCFYLTLHWMKMCHSRMIDDYYEIVRTLGEIERTLSLGTLNPLIRFKLTGDKARLEATRIFLEAFLNHFHEPAMDYVHLLMHHLLTLCRNRSHYSELPEFYLEIINETWLYVSQSQPHKWLQLHEPHDLFLRYAIMLLESPQNCRNIYVRAKIVEILNGWTAMGLDGHSLPLLRMFSMSYYSDAGQQSFCTAIVPLLFRMYVDVEVTGAASQFYEKFNIRFHITNILNLLWENLPEYKVAIRQEAGRPESFLRFQNILLNDCTYLLDESLGKLVELHRLQSASNSNAEEEMQQAQQIERQLTSYMQLTNGTLQLLALLTAECTAPFARPEIVSRLSAMLLVNLRHLVGNRCRELRVLNPERYHFDPRLLLHLLIKIIVSMSEEMAFCTAIRADQRSVDTDSLLSETVPAVLKRTNATPMHTFECYIEAINRIRSISVDSESDSDMCSEDEFMDPLMFTLMRDPVLLKTSKVVVDRTTIRAHLLNDPHDPFNRMPLTEDDLVSDEELRERIRLYLERKRFAKNN